MKYFVYVIDYFCEIPVGYYNNYADALLSVLETRRWYNPRICWYPDGVRIQIKEVPYD